ncbi:hypothetical protein [Couchioplanes caeruleus]|uniref:hypothetical protein n=1 Tax=Couchioplanes caeruleus TaxID=56438 RepID=UPI001160941F|nr:hypothetical protein [Couchioplanes caeruleus]
MNRRSKSSTAAKNSTAGNVSSSRGGPANGDLSGAAVAPVHHRDHIVGVFGVVVGGASVVGAGTAKRGVLVEYRRLLVAV